MAEVGQEAIGEGVGEGLNTLASQLRYNNQKRTAQRDQQADALAGQMQSIAENIVRVGGKDKPEAAPLIAQLNDVVRRHNALYPPHEAPALIQRLQGLIGKHTAAKIDPRSEATAGAAMASAPLPAYNTTDEYQRHQNALQGEFAQTNADLAQQISQKTNNATIEWAKAHGIPDDAIQELTAIHAGIPATLLKKPAEKSQNFDTISGHLKDGTPFSYQRSKFSGHVADMAGNDLDPAVLDGFVVDPKTAVKNKQAWINDPKTGKPLSVMLDANNHPIPGTENPDAVPPPSLFGRITTSDYITDDGFGNLVSVPKTTTTRPINSGGSSSPAPGAGAAPAGTPAAPAAGIPKTPAEARSLIAPPQTGPRIVGQKASGPEKSAQTDYDKATGVAKMADDALAHPSALTDKNLAISLARNASGRFSMAEFDTMIKKAGIANTLEGWANSVTTGQLPDDIRQQLVRVAKSDLLSAKTALESAHSASGHSGTGGSSVDDEILRKLDKLQVH